MKTTRQQVFETNSSSSHSITIADGSDLSGNMDVDDLGRVFIETGEYGWEIENYYDPHSKASYIATFLMGLDPKYHKDVCGMSIREAKDMFINVIKEHTKAREVVLNGQYTMFIDEGDLEDDGGYFYRFGYIDHQSVDVPQEALTSRETLRNFLFNPNSWFRTDNDNY